MYRNLIVFLLSMGIFTSANAQTTVPKFNCTIAPGCTFITDPWVLTTGTPPTPATQPVTCKLYKGTTATAANLLASSPVVAGTLDNPGADAASKACHIQAVIPAQQGINVIMTAVSVDGSESTPSTPFVFTSSSGAPLSPSNVRVKDAQILP